MYKRTSVAYLATEIILKVLYEIFALQFVVVWEYFVGIC
jgi:hypothetical protein